MTWPWLSRLIKKRPTDRQLALMEEAEFARRMAKRARLDPIRRYYELYARNLEESAQRR